MKKQGEEQSVKQKWLNANIKIKVRYFNGKIKQ